MSSSHLDQAKSVVLPHETYGKHFPGVNDIIICNDCTRDKANQVSFSFFRESDSYLTLLPFQNQANKRRKLENGEAECMLSSSYAEQSPRRDNNGETDSHSSGENSPRDYKIIFSNYSFATPMSTHKDMVPEPPRKNIKLKFKDCLEFTEEPIRPQADENLITLLREVMRTTKKNQKIVANEIGVSPTTMSSYMNSKSKPTGWNKMERKLKQWITSLEVEVPAPRESALPSDNPSVLSESKEEASTDESRSPSSMDTRASSWDYSPRQIEENKLKSDVSHCMSNYIDHVQYQQPTSIYKANPFNQYANESFVDLPSHAMEHGYYGHYPPLDQSSVSYTHPFTQPASEVDPHTQASFWPPLNLNLNFDHSQISY